MANCKTVTVRGRRRKLCFGAKTVKGCKRGGIISNTAVGARKSKAKSKSKKASSTTKTFKATKAYATNKDGSRRKGCTYNKKKREYRCRKPGK